MMKKVKEALAWIVNTLNKYDIPYQIEGGLAARAYGATRELADIDIFMPSFGFEKISENVQEYVEFGPGFHIGTHWRLNYQILNYRGQQIELCDADNAEYLNTHDQTWIKRDIDFSRTETIEIVGVPSKVIPEKDLLEYKSNLNREVDIIDIEQITSRPL